MIKIVHIQDAIATDRPYTYIGRAMRRFKLARSPLANPYTIGRDGDRDGVCDKYESEHLNLAMSARAGPIYDAVAAITKRHQEGVTVRLACWCTSDENPDRPQQRCHGHSIRDAALSLNDALPVGINGNSTGRFIPGLDCSFVNGAWVPNSQLRS